MNGQEIERLLTMIDANIAANQTIVKDEMLRFIESHEDQVVRELRAHASAEIPTSAGVMTIKLSDLRELVA